MAYKKVTIEHAKNLYLEGRLPLEISKILSIPERTIQRWKNKNDWEKEEKSASSLNLVYQLQSAFNKKLQEALDNEELGDPSVADTLVKLAAIMEKTIPKRMMLANILNMLTDVVLYFKNHVDDDVFVENFSTYIPELADFLKNKYASR